MSKENETLDKSQNGNVFIADVSGSFFSVGKITEIMIELKCEKCGIDYEKPADFKKWNDERPNVYFKWSLAFCDTCRRKREIEGLKRLPEVIKALAK